MIQRYAIISFFVLLSAGIVYMVFGTNGHEFTEDQCMTCHAVKPVKGKRDTLRMVASVKSLCARCHDKQENAISHPVEIVPARVVPPVDLPLSWEGKMTCSTCHDIHSAPIPGFGGKWLFLRRQTVGAAFCSSCHAGADTGKGDSHTQALGVAHMKYIPSAEGTRIDKASMTCLSCHDGSLGSANDVNSGSWKHGVRMSPFDPEGSHPIGVNYARAMRKHGGLRPVSQLNPAIKLIDGKVSCRSCHDMYATTYKKLVVTMSGSRLCFECHDK